MLEIIDNYDIEELSKNFNVKKYDNPFYKVLVLKKSNKIIGYLSFFIIYERIEVEYIYILKEERKNGYAKYLFQELFNIAKNNNCINISLEVDTTNNSAINLYKKLGFNIVSIREKYYGKNDGYLMIKELEV